MDTSASTSKSFSVQVVIELQKHKKKIQSGNKNTKSSQTWQMPLVDVYIPKKPA
jgi:hypothetical protein